MTVRRYIFILLVFNALFSLPRFSIETGASCIACHINPSGGGMRNDYGSNVYSIEELPLKRLIKNADDLWDGYITDNLQVGGDFRIQLYDNGEDSKIFPMQSDIYANLKISKNTDMYMKVDTGPDANNEFFVLFKNMFKSSWIKIGKTLPTYGLKLDDHTSFIRGGNRTPLQNSPFDDVDEGLFFDPQFNKNPTSLEMGVNLSKQFKLNISSSTGFFNAINRDEKEILNSSASLLYLKQFDSFSILSGISYMKEKDIVSKGLYGGVSINKWTMSFEVDEVSNWIDFYNSRAAYAQVVYKPVQGLHLVYKYDYFDRHLDFESGSISRLSAGFEIYPLSILEIKLQVRKNEIKNLPFAVDLKNEYLLQVHTWF